MKREALISWKNRAVSALVLCVLASGAVVARAQRRGTRRAAPRQTTHARAATGTSARTPARGTAQASPGASSQASSARTISVSTQANAAVWVDEVRRGTTDASGKLQLKLAPGRHTLRVRVVGFTERTLALLPT
ncbi:MAG: carboxypeptidase-like regulatory domain-containing protein, partial [Acidobacteriota bacterium]|nr:carboxypeptidase-like regulatory domain-containing protein [Acidobacteriota bacterium]